MRCPLSAPLAGQAGLLGKVCYATQISAYAGGTLALRRRTRELFGYICTHSKITSLLCPALLAWKDTHEKRFRTARRVHNLRWNKAKRNTITHERITLLLGLNKPSERRRTSLLSTS